MAENKNDLDYQNEAYHEIEENKSVFQAFKDFFNLKKALPGNSESKHKSTYVDIKTMMNLREFRANLVARVGDFFSALSKIGTPKKDENLNKFTKEVVGASNKEVAVEKERNDDEAVVSQETRYYPGDISINQETKVPSPETIIIAETNLENELDTDTIDAGNIKVDNEFEKDADRMEAATINVAEHPNLNKVSNQPNKNIIIPKAPGKTIKNNDNDRNDR